MHSTCVCTHVTVTQNGSEIASFFRVSCHSTTLASPFLSFISSCKAIDSFYIFIAFHRRNTHNHLFSKFCSQEPKSIIMKTFIQYNSTPYSNWQFLRVLCFRTSTKSQFFDFNLANSTMCAMQVLY